MIRKVLPPRDKTGTKASTKAGTKTSAAAKKTAKPRTRKPRAAAGQT